MVLVEGDVTPAVEVHSFPEISTSIIDTKLNFGAGIIDSKEIVITDNI